MRRLVCAAAVLLLTPSVALASEPVRLPTYEGADVHKGLAQHPQTIIWTGDGTGALERLSWHSWGEGTARAMGVNALRACVPDCASGHTTRYRVTVQAFARKQIHGSLLYSRVRYTFVNRPPKIENYQFPKTTVFGVSYRYGAYSIIVAPQAKPTGITECGYYNFINQHHGYWSARPKVHGYTPVASLTTRHVSCGYARPFALRVSRNFQFRGRESGFTCKTRVFNEEDYDIRCVRGGEVIHWQGGA